MSTADTLNVVGNAIGLLGALVKLIFDLFVNPFWHACDLDRKIDSIEAAKAKRNRADISTIWAFFFVGVGYALAIIALIK